MKTEVILKEVKKVLSDTLEPISDLPYEFEVLDGDMICHFDVTPLIVHKRVGVEVTLDWQNEPFLVYDKSKNYAEGPEISEEQFAEIEEGVKKLFAEAYLEQQEREDDGDDDNFDENAWEEYHLQRIERMRSINQ